MSVSQILSASVAKPVVEEPISDLFAIESLEENNALVSATQEMIETRAALEIAENAVTGLESLSAVVANAKEDGGLSAQSAALLTCGVESVMAPFGGYTAQPMPGLESFEDAGGQQVATDIALESVMTTIKKMWDAIVEITKKAVAAIKKWFSEMFTSLKGMEKSAKKLAEKAKDAKGEPSEKELAVKSPHMLMAGGKLTGLEASGIGKLVGAIKTANSEFITMASDALDLQNDYIDAIDGGAEGVKDKVVAANRAAIDKATKGKTEVKDDRVDDGVKAYAVTATDLPGGTLVVAIDVGKPGAYLIDVLAPVADKDSKDVKAPALTAKDIEDVAGEIAKVAVEAQKGEKLLKSFDKVSSGAEKAGNQMVKAVKEDEKLQGAVKDAMSNMRAINMTLTKASSDATRHFIGSARASMAFCVASMKNLKEAK